MKKFAILIIVILALIACEKSDYIFIEDSKLVSVTLIPAKGSGYINTHWMMTFENGITMRNWDTGYSIGKLYRISYDTINGKYRAELKINLGKQ